MKKYDTIIFDFDGTVVDSAPGVTKSAQYALEMEFGIIEPDLEKLRVFCGPPLYQSFTTFYSLTPDDAERAVNRFRERYAVVGFTESTLFEGMVELLLALRARGLKTGIASSKSADMLLRSLDDMDIRQYFDVVLGIEETLHHKTKTELIKEALCQLDADPEKALMIGDRHFDAEGAAAAGIDFVAALYGGTAPKEEFDGYPVVFYAGSPADVGRYIETHS